jgi:hypothetical protein
MGLAGQGPNRDLPERLRRLRLEIGGLAEQTAPITRAQERARRRRGQMTTAIEAVLASAGEMRTPDIHAAVALVLAMR